MSALELAAALCALAVFAAFAIDSERHLMESAGKANWHSAAIFAAQECAFALNSIYSHGGGKYTGRACGKNMDVRAETSRRLIFGGAGTGITRGNTHGRPALIEVEKHYG